MSAILNNRPAIQIWGFPATFVVLCVADWALLVVWQSCKEWQNGDLSVLWVEWSHVRVESAIESISWLGNNRVHMRVHDISNTVPNQDISQINNTSLGIWTSNEGHEVHIYIYEAMYKAAQPTCEFAHIGPAWGSCLVCISAVTLIYDIYFVSQEQQDTSAVLSVIQLYSYQIYIYTSSIYTTILYWHTQLYLWRLYIRL